MALTLHCAAERFSGFNEPPRVFGGEGGDGCSHALAVSGPPRHGMARGKAEKKKERKVRRGEGGTRKRRGG